MRRSREGAWIEIHSLTAACKPCICRSREGAWIEILLTFGKLSALIVAPARERGLKLSVFLPQPLTKCRSREGAWIEMMLLISLVASVLVAPARERGLK